MSHRRGRKRSPTSSVRVPSVRIDRTKHSPRIHPLTASTEAPRKIRSKDIAKREEHERKMNRRRREAMAEAGLSEHFVSTIGEVALKAKHWGPLEYLIKSRCLYAHTLPDLMTALIEHKRLVRTTYLPEAPRR